MSPDLRLFDGLRGQDTAVATLHRALASGRVHHAYLFDGPEGVGKELAALALAQALVCERRGVDAPADTACGACSACRRVPMKGEQRRPAHPDVAILERGLYEPAQIGRRTPETQDLSIDQVRTLVLARAAFPPHEGRAKVFIVRRAEELSISAANALLKTLEEPGQSTHFVLISARPGELLPTIRSRTQRLRFGPLPDAVVEDILRERGIDAARAKATARLAGGSAGVAMGLADEEATEAREAFVQKALAAATAKDAGPVFDLAEEAKKVKGDLATLLNALADALAQETVRAAKAFDARADAFAERHRLVLETLRQLDGNASAQLAVEALLLKMR